MFQLGIIIVILSLVIGFIGGGGNILVLIHPFEALIILGTAIGSFIISNSKTSLTLAFTNIHKVTKREPYSKEDYVELLSFLFNLLKYSKSNSKMDLETQIEYPEKSFLFKRFKKIFDDKQVTTFISDYMRLIVLGFENPYELQQMMEDELFEKKIQGQNLASCFNRLGDSLPGLGIIAAVLGVINAMASIAADPSVLGRKIAAALIGTFLGVFLSYGIISPIGAFFEGYTNEEVKFLECIKAAIVSHAKGHPPTISIECARQIIPDHLKPSFIELEKSLKKNLIVR
ncbi:flagellar motor stator protein MotA [Candidatus Jidaibacter acanthamoebae]|uniref:flagellar motor stator protein MotA n=1 Tax=Candidatus Jidaibacter acanthamoebae TaxID=86105 RepID=UPI00057DC20E|nr:flagellar motor stator protein MotA [Candidatus Jidaibacter acanthamoeba]